MQPKLLILNIDFKIIVLLILNYTCFLRKLIYQNSYVFKCMINFLLKMKQKISAQKKIKNEYIDIIVIYKEVEFCLSFNSNNNINAYL